jgi:hypothetical protein
MLNKKSDRKDTPDKYYEEEIGRPKVKIIEFQDLSWCAARDKCKNSLQAATTEVKCIVCTNNVH